MPATHAPRSRMPQHRGFRRLALGAALTAALLLFTGQIALALPSQRADQTSGFDGKVRAVFKAGGAIWVGGAFDRVVDVDPGPAVAIAALDPSSGGRAAGISPPSLGGPDPTVFDFSISPSGVLYAAGTFTYSGGRNLVGLNPSTGAVVQTFSVPSARTVFATADRILVGKEKIRAYEPSGDQIGSFEPLVALVDDSIRGHETPSQFRDIGQAADGDAIAVGQFDLVNGETQKVAVKFDPQTGAIRDWDLSDLNAGSGAFGIELEIVGSTLYVAAGGSDFAAAYRVSDGQQLWKTDTSGSSQAIALWDANTVIVGGHFQWVAFGGASQCGSNGSPNTSCLNQPRLVAMDAGDGTVDASWRPNVCCRYNGVWSLIVDGTRLHIGGEFTKIGNATQRFYARFTEGGGPPPDPRSFADGFESGDLRAWTSSKRLTVQSDRVHTGSFAAENSRAKAWASTELPSAHDDVYVRMWLKVVGRHDTFQVMRLRSGPNRNVVILTVTRSGRLQIRNAVTGEKTTTSAEVRRGWNDVQLHATVGGSGDLELWLGGSRVADLGPVNLGQASIRRVEIGNRAEGKDHHAYYDDVEIDDALLR